MKTGDCNQLPCLEPISNNAYEKKDGHKHTHTQNTTIFLFQQLDKNKLYCFDLRKDQNILLNGYQLLSKKQINRTIYIYIFLIIFEKISTNKTHSTTGDFVI